MMMEEETFIDFEFCWFVHADVYDSSNMKDRIAFFTTIISTETPVISPEMYDEIMYEQVKKPFIDQMSPDDLGCVEGYLFDITSLTYVGQNYFNVYYEEETEQIEEL